MSFIENDILFLCVYGIAKKLLFFDFLLKVFIFVLFDEKVSSLFLELIRDDNQIAQIEGRLVERYIALASGFSNTGLQ
jgi:hypothetical protein